MPAIVVVIAENANAEICVVENKTAEIAHERLNAGSHGNKIVIVRQIAHANFAERFLQRVKFFLPRRPVLRIRIHDVSLFHVDVVAVVNAENAQCPIDGLKCGFTLEKIHTDRKIVRVEKLIAQPKKLRTVRARRAHTTRCGQLARFELKKILRSDVEENVLTDDWRVAFEFALQVGMP